MPSVPTARDELAKLAHVSHDTIAKARSSEVYLSRESWCHVIRPQIRQPSIHVVL